MSESPDTPSCWVLTPGHAGMENQAIGLAERTGLPFEVRRVRPRRPWTWLPPGWWPAPLAALPAGDEAIAPPWPDLLITCGRRSVPFSLHIRRVSRGRTFTVHIQDPKTAPQRFDLVVPPRHDRLSGANVIETLGALHRVTPARLAAEAERFAPRLAHLPRPLVAVLIGGSSSAYRLTPAIMAALSDRLAALDAGLAVTPSRRTGAANLAVLRERLAPTGAEIWNFDGPNPYFGYLGLADAIIVTCDSATMVSEACATGKPVHVVELDGGSRKFRAFHRALREAGHTRRFDGRLEHWACPALDETGDIAREVLARLARHGGA